MRFSMVFQAIFLFGGQHLVTCGIGPTVIPWNPGRVSMRQLRGRGFRLVPIGSIYGIYIYANIKGVYWWDPWSTIYSSTMDPMGYRMYRSKMSWANDFNQSERHLTMNSNILTIYRTAATDQSQFRCFFNRFFSGTQSPKNVVGQC